MPTLVNWIEIKDPEMGTIIYNLPLAGRLFPTSLFIPSTAKALQMPRHLADSGSRSPNSPLEAFPGFLRSGVSCVRLHILCFSPHFPPSK